MQQLGDPGAFQRGVTPLKPFSWAPKTGTTNFETVGSYTGLNAQHQLPEEYIGESGRTFWYMLQGHLMALAPIHHHCHSTGYPVSPECFTVVEREVHGVTRNIKEAMYICVNGPSLISKLGKYQLLHIWDEVSQEPHHLRSNNTALPTYPSPHGPPPYVYHTI